MFDSIFYINLDKIKIEVIWLGPNLKFRFTIKLFDTIFYNI